MTLSMLAVRLSDGITVCGALAGGCLIHYAMDPALAGPGRSGAGLLLVGIFDLLVCIVLFGRTMRNRIKSDGPMPLPWLVLIPIILLVGWTIYQAVETLRVHEMLCVQAERQAQLNALDDSIRGLGQISQQSGRDAGARQWEVLQARFADAQDRLRSWSAATEWHATLARLEGELGSLQQPRAESVGQGTAAPDNAQRRAAFLTHQAAALRCTRDLRDLAEQRQVELAHRVRASTARLATTAVLSGMLLLGLTTLALLASRAAVRRAHDGRRAERAWHAASRRDQQVASAASAKELQRLKRAIAIAAEETAEARQELDAMLDALPIGHSRIAPDGRLLRANAALAAMLGYATADALREAQGGNVFRLFGDDEEGLLMERLLGTTGDCRVNLRASGMGKERAELRITARPSHKPTGELRYVDACVVLDEAAPIARKLAEREHEIAAIREEHARTLAGLDKAATETRALAARLEQTIAAAPGILWQASVDDLRVISISPQIEGLLGRSAEECRAEMEFWDHALSADCRDDVLARLHAVARDGGDAHFSLRLNARDGRAIRFHASVACCHANEQAARLSGVFVPAEEPVPVPAEASRTEDPGSLEVVHAFDDALTVIFGHTEVALASLPADHRLVPPFDAIRDAAARIAHLTQPVHRRHAA